MGGKHNQPMFASAPSQRWGCRLSKKKGLTHSPRAQEGAVTMETRIYLFDRSKSRNSDQADGLEGKDMVVVVEVTAAPNILEAKDIIGEPAEMG